MKAPLVMALQGASRSVRATYLASAGVAVGCACVILVSVLGGSANADVRERFEASQIVTITVLPSPGVVIQDSNVQRVQQIEGVLAASRWIPIGTTRRGVQLHGTSASETRLYVYCADERVLDVVGGTTTPHPGAATQLGNGGALLGREGARVLGIDLDDDQPNTSLVVEDLGTVEAQIVTEVEYLPEVLGGLVVSCEWVSEATGETPTGDASIRLRVQAGAQGYVEQTAALAADPYDTRSFHSVPPPIYARLQSDVQGRVDVLRVLLASICSLVGAMTIGVVQHIAIHERRGEIGVAMALGHTRADILRQFIYEGTLIGLVGSTLGTAVGLAAASAVILIAGWPPQFSWPTPLGTVVLATCFSAAATALPARRAAAVDPSSILSR